MRKVRALFTAPQPPTACSYRFRCTDTMIWMRWTALLFPPPSPQRVRAGPPDGLAEGWRPAEHPTVRTQDCSWWDLESARCLVNSVLLVPKVASAAVCRGWYVIGAACAVSRHCPRITAPPCNLLTRVSLQYALVLLAGVVISAVTLVVLNYALFHWWGDAAG